MNKGLRVWLLFFTPRVEVVCKYINKVESYVLIVIVLQCDRRSLSVELVNLMVRIHIDLNGICISEIRENEGRGKSLQ